MSAPMDTLTLRMCTEYGQAFTVGDLRIPMRYEDNDGGEHEIGSCLLGFVERVEASEDRTRIDVVIALNPAIAVLGAATYPDPAHEDVR